MAAAVGAAQEVDSKAFAELWDEAGRRGLSGIGIDPKCLMQLHQALPPPPPPPPPLSTPCARNVRHPQCNAGVWAAGAALILHASRS